MLKIVTRLTAPHPTARGIDSRDRQMYVAWLVTTPPTGSGGKGRVVEESDAIKGGKHLVARDVHTVAFEV